MTEEEITKMKGCEKSRVSSLGVSATQICPDYLLGSCALWAACSMEHQDGRHDETKPKAKGKAKAKAKAVPKAAAK